MANFDDFVFIGTTPHLDVTQVHGFYRLETPDGRFLEFRHHCPINGDFGVQPARKGTVVIHCPERKREIFDPDAEMPTVVRRGSGAFRFPGGSAVFVD